MLTLYSAAAARAPDATLTQNADFPNEAIAIKTCGGKYVKIKYIGTSNFLEVANAIAFEGYSLQSLVKKEQVSVDATIGFVNIRFLQIDNSF